MSRLVSLWSKSMQLGPLPYLGLSVGIIAMGAVLQLRSGTVDNLGNGISIFGTFARIGGLVGLYGLLPLIFSNGLAARSDRGAAREDRAHGLSEGAPDPVPASARARIGALVAASAVPLSEAGNAEGGLKAVLGRVLRRT